MPVDEATIEESPYGRYVRSAGWFVLNLSEADADWPGDYEPVRLPWPPG